MKPVRAILTTLALGAASVAMIACSDASANEDDVSTPMPTATAPATNNPDTPTSPGDPTPAPTETPDWDHERVEEEAPIEEVEVLVLESLPPQYRLKIVSGLPSGCAAFERTDVEREGDTFNITVINTMPAPDADIACTMIYGYHEQTIALEDIESGVEYTVIVNGETTTFQGQ